MRRSRLMAILTAALLLGGAPSVHAAYTLAQLQVIDSLIAQGNLSGLRRFLLQNPEILEGNDPLAVELREFIQEQQAGPSGFGFADDDDNDNNAFALSPTLLGNEPY